MDSRESGRKAEPLERLEIGNPAVSGIVTSGLDAMKLRRSRADWQRRGGSLVALVAASRERFLKSGRGRPDSFGGTEPIGAGNFRVMRGRQPKKRGLIGVGETR